MSWLSYVVRLLQHLRTSKGSQKMEYFVIGAANFVDPSLKHKDAVPAGSSIFHWADYAKMGGFAFFEATSNNMTFKFIDGDKQTLYEQVLFPRKL